MTLTNDLLGKNLGQYELRAVINAGAIVDTYLGYQPMLERDQLHTRIGASSKHRTRSPVYQLQPPGYRLRATTQNTSAREWPTGVD